jgi:hypothetical protein
MSDAVSHSPLQRGAPQSIIQAARRVIVALR